MPPAGKSSLIVLLLMTACAPAEPTEAVDLDPTMDAGSAGDIGPTVDAGSTVDTGPTADAGPTVDAASPPPASEPAFTHKMMQRTGENMFASLAYECSQCTFAHQQAIVPPPGWTKGPTQVVLFSSGEMRSRPMFEDVPDAMDFLPDVPGAEYELIAKNLDGTLIERGGDRIVVVAQVMRDTLLRFTAGRRVHELTDPDGNVFVLFAYGVDPVDPVIPDVQDPDLMADFTPPEGWTYGSRVLEEELLLDTPDIAQVLAIRGTQDSTWEMR